MLLSFQLNGLRNLVFMRFFALFLLIFTASLAVFSQQDGTAAVVRNAATPEAGVTADTDREALEKAIAVEDPFERIEALKDFIAEFGESGLRIQALESLSSARASAGDTKLRAKESSEAVTLFKLAVEEAPGPISDDLFSKVLVNIPLNLFVLNQRDAAFEIANMLETRSSANAKHLLRLATFHFSIKYATGARRLVEKARDISPEDPLVYQSLGAAYRLGFDLTGAIEAYAKALSLEPDSPSIRQNLADLRRATGDYAAAEVLLREILREEPEDLEANTGLVLCLFDQGRREEAETLMSEVLSSNPRNGFLRIGSANWYASNGEPDLAINNAQEALKLDQDAVWAHIVMGRAYMKKGDPANAEKSLLAAARLAASPTIAYELALARVAAGFYRDAGDVLKMFFAVENGQIVTDLDGRIGVEADNFSDLISLERKSVLFTPVNGYESKSDQELKSLLTFENILGNENSSAQELEKAANAFIGADDPMRTHRQLFVASKLLDAGRSPDEAGRIAREAIAGVEKSLEIPSPASAVMADQLYRGRKLAAEAGRLILVPEVEKATLNRIMRGRIEEIAARSVLASGDLPSAQIRLKRAVAVLPKDSAWWRSSMWRLGTVYERLGDDRNALASYAASYSSGEKSVEERSSIEAVYQRVNGSLVGIEDYLAKKQAEETDLASRFTKASVATSAPAEANRVSTPDPGQVTAETKNTIEDAPLSNEPEVPVSEVNEPAPDKTASAEKSVMPEDVRLILVPPTAIPVLQKEESEKPAVVEAEVEKPVVDETADKASVVEHPVEKPMADEKTAEENAIIEPTIEKPVADEKTAAENAVIEPTIKKPVADDKPAEENAIIEPTIEKPVADEKTAEENAVIEPPVEKPVADEKTVEENAVIEPAIEKPVADDKTADQASAPEPLVEKPVTDDKALEENAVVETPSEEPASKTVPAKELSIDKEPADAENVSDETFQRPALVDTPAEKPKTVESPADVFPGALEESVSKSKATELIDLGATRPRIVDTTKIRAKPDECSVILSQDRVSIISNGGSFGVVVGLNNYQKAYVLRATSGSPEDVSITFEPEIGSVEGRAFFVIKSISARTGVFSVAFATPCGTRTVVVEVH